MSVAPSPLLAFRSASGTLTWGWIDIYTYADLATESGTLRLDIHSGQGRRIDEQGLRHVRVTAQWVEFGEVRRLLAVWPEGSGRAPMTDDECLAHIVAQWHGLLEET